MTRYLIVVAAFCLASLGCRGASPAGVVTTEAPPPLIEPTLGTGSALIEPRAEALVRAMSDRLSRVTAFTIEADEINDEVPEHSPRRQLTNSRRVTVRRPGRLAGDASGDAVNRSFFYDGRTLTVYDKEQNVWTSGNVPPTIDEALDWVFDQTGTVIPLADFLYADVYARLMGNVQRGVYLGLHEAAGVMCHHLSFEQANIDWQVWIDAGRDPLPRKLVIAYKTEDEVPRYSVTIRKWDLQAAAPEASFTFTPPASARRIEITAMTGAPTAGPTGAQEKK